VYNLSWLAEIKRERGYMFNWRKKLTAEQERKERLKLIFSRLSVPEFMILSYCLYRQRSTFYVREPITTSFERAVINLTRKGIFVPMAKDDGGHLYHIPLAVLTDILSEKTQFYLAFAQANLTTDVEMSLTERAAQLEGLWMSQYQDYDYHLEACGY
jgi:hypothetical protein